MKADELSVGKIVHYQQSGWHGMCQIHSFNSRWIYYIDIENIKELRKSCRSLFLKYHSVGSCWGPFCDYQCQELYDHIIGKVLPVGGPYPKRPRRNYEREKICG